MVSCNEPGDNGAGGGASNYSSEEQVVYGLSTMARNRNGSWIRMGW